MPRRTGTSGAWVLAATILGSSMAFVDGTVVNVALPALQRGLHATVPDLQWVVEAYALFFSSLLLVGGALGDRLGRRRVYAAGIVVFAGASAACGLARDASVLVVARAVQGVGAALLVPGSLALIAATFPAGERGRAIGTWSGLSAMTTAFGPVLGGFLIDHLSWRWAFFVNLPLAAAALALLFLHVDESRDDSARGGLDVAGAWLVTLGLGGIVYGLTESGRAGWGAPAIVVTLAGGGIALASFFAFEARAQAPMLPLGLFRSRRFLGANLLTFWLYGALSMIFFALPMDLIEVQGFSATAAGAALLPFIGIMVVLSRWSGGLLERVDARVPLTVGPLVAAVGFALFARPGVGAGYWSTFFPATCVLGLGMAITVAPLTTTVMNAVPVIHAGVASGVNNAVSRVAGLLAIALLTLPLVAVFEAHLAQGLARSAVRPDVAADVLAHGASLAVTPPPGFATPEEARVVRAVVAESFVAGFRWVALVSALLAALGALTTAGAFAGESRRTGGQYSANASST